MNKKTKFVLELLKPKAKSLGFTKEELEGVAAKIADNLGLDDDASDEQLNAAATKEVDAAIFHLELAQSHANRLIQKKEEERKAAEEAAKKAAEEEAAKKAAEEEAARKKAEEEEAAKKAEEERKAAEEAARKAAEEAGFQKLLESDWAKGLKAENEKLSQQLKEQTEAFEKQKEEAKKQLDEFTAFRNEFNAMKAEQVKASREKQLNELVKDCGVYGERIKKNYGKMTFNTDDEFTEFLDGVKDDIKALNQERADKGLDNLGAPGVGETKKEDGKADPMSDAEVDALAAIL